MSSSSINSASFARSRPATPTIEIELEDMEGDKHSTHWFFRTPPITPAVQPKLSAKDLKLAQILSEVDKLNVDQKSLIFKNILNSYVPKPASSNRASMLLFDDIKYVCESNEHQNNEKIEELWGLVKKYIEPCNDHRTLYKVIVEKCKHQLQKKSEQDNNKSHHACAALESVTQTVALPTPAKVSELFNQLQILPISEIFLILYEIYEKSPSVSSKNSRDLKWEIFLGVGYNCFYEVENKAKLKKAWGKLKAYMQDGSNAHRSFYTLIYNICLKRTLPEDVNTKLGHGKSDVVGVALQSFTTFGLYPLFAIAPHLPSYCIDKFTRRHTLSLVEIYKVLHKLGDMQNAKLSVDVALQILESIVQQYHDSKMKVVSRESSHSQKLIKKLVAWKAQLKEQNAAQQASSVHKLWGMLGGYLQEKRPTGVYVLIEITALRARQNNGKKLFLAICNVIHNFNLPPPAQLDEFVVQ